MWDALSSDRAYRPAWPADQALSHVVAGGGVLFDPACVEAFVDVLGEEHLWPERVDLDPAALIAAAEACHRATSRNGVKAARAS